MDGYLSDREPDRDGIERSLVAKIELNVVESSSHSITKKGKTVGSVLQCTDFDGEVQTEDERSEWDISEMNLTHASIAKSRTALHSGAATFKVGIVGYATIVKVFSY